jgi:hypothetical protein
METRSYKVYRFSELSKESKQKAIDKWYEHEDYPFLEENLTKSCAELLKSKKVKIIDNNLELGYSLSYSQGDGLHFKGNFEWKKYIVKITHSWRYEFAESANITLYKNDEEIEEDNKDYILFKVIYLDICSKLEKEGYAELEYRMDFDEFDEHCEANGYMFTIDGKLD